VDDVQERIPARERFLVGHRKRLVDDLARPPDALLEETLPRADLRMRHSEAEPVVRPRACVR
jgi:hypothetical protein